jgi:hypothetical protein
MDAGICSMFVAVPDVDTGTSLSWAWFTLHHDITTRNPVIYDEIVMMKSEIVTDQRIAHSGSNWARFL